MWVLLDFRALLPCHPLSKIYKKPSIIWHIFFYLHCVEFFSTLWGKLWRMFQMWVLLDYRAFLPCHRILNFYKKTSYYFKNIFLFTLCKTIGKGSHRNQLKHYSVIKWAWYLQNSKTSFTEDLVVNRTTMYILIFLGCVVPTTCYECWHSFSRFPPPCSETHLLRPTIWGLQTWILSLVL